MSEVEQNADQGQRARPVQFKVQIAGAELEFHETVVNDPVPTGRQIAQASGEGNPEDLIVLLQLPTFELEELRLGETTDLRASGVERFIVAKSDRTFRLIVDGIKLEWPFSNPLALIAKKLVGKGDGFALVQEFDDRPDQVLADNTHLHLEGKGTERFKTRKVVRLVKVEYNATQVFELEARKYTDAELRQIFGVPEGYILERIAEDGEFVETKPGDKVKIEDCMAFFSHAPQGGSS